MSGVGNCEAPHGHTRTDALNLTNIWDTATPANNQNFWYTASNKLQNANGPWGSKTFYYDGVGNRTQEIHLGRTLSDGADVEGIERVWLSREYCWANEDAVR